MSCGSPDQDVADTGVETADQTVLAGTVVAGAEPVGGAFVRLLDSGGEFTGEVVSSDAGRFRFFAGPGDWTVRALHRSGNGQAEVSAAGPGRHELTISLA
jgi:hypothetical protein